MWAGLTARFTAFHSNVLLTSDQLEDGRTKSRGITAALNAAYWGTNSQSDNAFWVGSWGKTTQARPPRDIDLFFVLPAEVYNRISQVAGNKQSALLQEVKGVLQAIPLYAQTTMRGDGQVVVVAFNSITVEVLPCFRRTDGKFIICNTNDGGSWTVTDPSAEVEFIENGDVLTSRNLRIIIRMLKIWKRECNVPIKSYVLETLATSFLKQSEYRHNGYFYYDWIFRDFFKWLIGCANLDLRVADLSVVPLGDEWKSRAESAYARALRACDHERDNYIEEAGDEWQKIFGQWIPKHVTPEPSLLLPSV